MYKKLVFGAALLCGVSSAAQAMVSIDGTYSCSVTDLTLAQSSHATGRFAIKKNGEIYAISQLNADGTQPVPNEYNIFGIRSENILSLAYQKVNDAKIFGVEQFKISKDGKTLHGTFVYFNQLDKKNSEVCKRV
jgi:hypothetical protein